MSKVRKWLVVVVAFCAAGLQISRGFELLPPGSPDWGQARRAVAARAAQPGTDFAKLAQRSAAAEPEDAQEAMFHLNVLLRAGMEREALDMLGKLQSLWPELPPDQVGKICDAAEESGVLAVTRRALEQFEGTVSGLNLSTALLRPLERNGWTFEQIDAWLAERPAGRKAFWVEQRLRFRRRHGRASEFIDELLEGIRMQPEDIGSAINLLHVLPSGLGRDSSLDLGWLADVLNPRLATEGRDLGDALRRLKNWQPALAFYRRALEIPVTEQEVEAANVMSPVFVTREKLQRGLDVRLRESMSKCLLELDRPEEAHTLMVEAADIREEHGSSIDLVFAGRTQAAAGASVIEQRVRAREDHSGDDPYYWLDRARYYQGRKEQDEEEKALNKALALTRVEPPDEKKAERLARARGGVLSRYAMFLSRMDRRGEAVALLSKELANHPLGPRPAEAAARTLVRYFEHDLSVDQEAIWQWVSERPKWDSLEARLLGYMLADVSPPEIGPYFDRIEGMAKGEDLSRLYVAGSVIYHPAGHYTRVDPRRAIALWEHAFDLSEDPELRQRVASRLFGAYLHVNDWVNAELILPETSGHFAPNWRPRSLGRLAVAAARAGDRQDAVRFWAAATNINPAQMEALPDLLTAGLEEELRTFYADMRRRMPTSNIPDRALRRIEEH
ncbi:MAG: hypothetical protein ACOC7S_02540 [Planctomycetota bacterium]